jgi:hypothetical protein
MLSLMIALLLAVSSPALAASAYTHCNANEIVVYSCSTGSHTLSICASPDISKDHGYLQYRYGLRRKLELVYPESFRHPASLFNPGNLMFSGGGGTYLQFKKEGYTYTVFSAVGKWGKSCFSPQEEPQTCLRDIEGIAVQKDGKEVANIPCKQGADYVPGEFGPAFWDKIGLGEGSSQEEFDIPEAFFKK